jgi:hypothetical protein
MALIANIFSMQQASMPFPQSPKSFWISAVTATIIVSLAHLFGIYALPPIGRSIISLCIAVWRRINAIWIKEQDEAELRRRIVAEDGTGVVQ